MPCKGLLLALGLVLMGLLLDVRAANACSCVGTPTVLQAYEMSGVVVIARAVSVEKGEGYGGISSTKMIVEKVFKGDLKTGDEMTFAQGAGTDCMWGFNEQSVGTQYLFYLGSREQHPKIWAALACGRSASLQSATEDLLYLDRLEEVRGKSRISGKIRFVQENDLGLGGRVVRITGNDKTYEVITDKNGVFEIYGLPAGNYSVEPEAPAGWKLINFGRSFISVNTDQERSPKKVALVLEDKGHSSLDLGFEIDNLLRGKLYDPNGNPMKDVCIKAVHEQGKSRGEGVACTDADGSFAFAQLPRGGYILVVNYEGKISGSAPFKTFYYPNVSEREKAVAIAIREGEVIEGANIYVPKVEESVVIEGFFLYSDGKPVALQQVQFKAEKAKNGIEGDAGASTDSSGRFSFKVLKGLKGKLHGEMFTYAGEFENCPQLEAVIKKTGESANVETAAVEIQAEDDLHDVELRYPFPSCKRAN